MILLDTDYFSVLMDARHARHAQLASRLVEVDEPVQIPVASVEEQPRAWLAQIRRVRDPYKLIVPYERLARLLTTLAEWELANWSVRSADEFAKLRRARIHIGTQDLRIAAIAIATSGLLLSANLRDLERVPNLRVEDWLYE